VSWSGGKDSTLALAAALADQALEVRALVTTVTAEYERISMHGVRRALLRRQAEALGLPLVEVPIAPRCSNEDYERAMREALARLAAEGVTGVVCGDLYLADVRAYRERLFAGVGLAGVYPLWGRDTRALAHEFVDAGYRAVLVCVDPRQIDRAFCGRDYDRALLAELPATADPCGENGEFHTFVHDGPIFHAPIPVARGEVVERDGFVFADLEVARGLPQPTIAPLGGGTFTPPRPGSRA
jgi:uncharacterized protein (TIGR00290 family)